MKTKRRMRRNQLPAIRPYPNKYPSLRPYPNAGRSRRNNGELPPYQPFRPEGGIISGPKQTAMYQLLALSKALKLETTTGLQLSRGASASAIIKHRFPFIKGRSKKKIYAQFAPWVDKVLSGKEPYPGYEEKPHAWHSPGAQSNRRRRGRARRNALNFSTREMELLAKLPLAITSVRRRSERPFDLSITGKELIEFPGKGASWIDFGAWLPLAAIRHRTRWTSKAIADMTDVYPPMVLEGDWSGVRDSSKAAIWRIFDKHVLQKLR